MRPNVAQQNKRERLLLSASDYYSARALGLHSFAGAAPKHSPCHQVCQDKAQTVMRDGGSESKAKTAMESCAHGIIMENIAGLAGVDKRIRAGLKANNVI